MNARLGVSRRGRADAQQQSGAQPRNDHIEAHIDARKSVHTEVDRQGSSRRVANHGRRAPPRSTSCQKATPRRRERLDRVRGEPRPVRGTPGGSKQTTGQTEGDALRM
ncbi:hypothetical protein V6N13_098743 [Hibiscus sabdariffa]